MARRPLVPDSVCEEAEEIADEHEYSGIGEAIRHVFREWNANGEGEPIDQRGVYLMADTPLKGHPLALEDGSGDKQLLAEVLVEYLDLGEIDELAQELIEQSNEIAERREEAV